MRLPAGNRGFRFWLVTISAVLGIGVTGSLGAWQMRRAAEKIELQHAIEAKEALPPLGATELRAQPQSALLHRTVVLKGTWIAEHTVYLDNRQMQARPGFYVVTPLRIENSGAVALVERGWVPRNFERRDKLPPVETPNGVVEVRGRMAPGPAKLYEFNSTDAGPIRQNLDLERFRAETGLPLLGVSIQQLGPPSEGLLREWPAPSLGIERHWGYAFQWWALAGLIAILYVWFQFIVPRKARAAR